MSAAETVTVIEVTSMGTLSTEKPALWEEDVPPRFKVTRVVSDSAEPETEPELQLKRKGTTNIIASNPVIVFIFNTSK
jgi:hypothetical protein